MNICDAKRSKHLVFNDLKMGNVFAWATGAQSVGIKTQSGFTYLSSVGADGNHHQDHRSNALVVLYPDACINLGEPAS